MGDSKTFMMPVRFESQTKDGAHQDKTAQIKLNQTHKLSEIYPSPEADGKKTSPTKRSCLVRTTDMSNLSDAISASTYNAPSSSHTHADLQLP